MQLINEPYLIIIPIIIIIGAYYGYLLEIKKNKTVIKINKLLFISFVGFVSIFGTIFFIPFLLKNLNQIKEAPFEAKYFLIPLSFLIIFYILFIKEITKIIKRGGQK